MHSNDNPPASLLRRLQASAINLLLYALLLGWLFAFLRPLFYFMVMPKTNEWMDVDTPAVMLAAIMYGIEIDTYTFLTAFTLSLLVVRLQFRCLHRSIVCRVAGIMLLTASGERVTARRQMVVATLFWLILLPISGLLILPISIKWAVMFPFIINILPMPCNYPCHCTLQNYLAGAYAVRANHLVE